MSGFKLETIFEVVVDIVINKTNIAIVEIIIILRKLLLVNPKSKELISLPINFVPNLTASQAAITT